MKNITFTKKDGSLVVYSVATEKLQGTARVLAELVKTTENRDDYSDIRVVSKYTNRELYEQNKEIVIQYKDGEVIVAKKYDEAEIAKIETFYGKEFLETHPTILWRWGALRDDETPEGYFERHAERIEGLGGIVDATEPREFESKLPVDLREVFSIQEAAELLGIDDSTIRKAISAGRFEPSEYRKTGRNFILTRVGLERVYGKSLK